MKNNYTKCLSSNFIYKLRAKPKREMVKEIKECSLKYNLPLKSLLTELLLK